ncbi:MAG: hypothetical protein EPN74_17215 [Rhodanobacter sp.]|nr:MAG: hypothetical protein EPN74_17215 [Rhodanobacter sp.]
MTNTIELLETIGRDASLRHASGEDLSQAIIGLQASEALKLAAISGDDGHLAKELGHRDVKTPNHVSQNHAPCHDDGNGKDGDEDHDKDHGVAGEPE